VVSITHDMMGGEFEQGTREISLTWDALSRTSNVGMHIHRLKQIAIRTDRGANREMLAELADAANKLDAEMQKYQHRVSVLRNEIAMFAGIIMGARDATPPTEPTVHPDLGDEDVIDRMADLYGIPKPRRRR